MCRVIRSTLGVVFADTRFRRVGALAVVTAAVSLLSGCFLLEGPTPETPERVKPELPPVTGFDPDGSAEDNWPYFTQVLTEFAEDDAKVNGKNVVNAVVDSGFDPETMQVSFDRTKTDLVADNIFVSVLIDEACLIGQVVTGDREVVTEVLPAVGPDKDICLIGETREIDFL